MENTSNLKDSINLAVIRMPFWSLKLYFKVQIPIAHTTVAGAMAITSQLKQNLNIK